MHLYGTVIHRRNLTVRAKSFPEVINCLINLTSASLQIRGHPLYINLEKDDTTCINFLRQASHVNITVFPHICVDEADQVLTSTMTLQLHPITQWGLWWFFRYRWWWWFTSYSFTKRRYLVKRKNTIRYLKILLCANGL